MSDRATRLHLEDVRHRIARTLDPSARPAGASGRSARPALADDAFEWGDGRLDSWNPLVGDVEWCWPDYAVRRVR